MKKKQLVVLEVVYEDDNPPEGPQMKYSPESWDWNRLIDEPYAETVVIGVGPIIEL